MRFLAKDEVHLLEKRLLREIAERGQPKFVLYYESRDRDYSAAANAIVTSAGKLSEATVIFSFAVSGDGWNEDLATNKRWQRYKDWRAANHESRRLYDAPGHRFEPDEVEQLSIVVAFALDLGWDAIVTAKPGRQILVLSHDDRLEIYRGFKGGALARQLIDLGYWRRAESSP